MLYLKGEINFRLRFSITGNRVKFYRENLRTVAKFAVIQPKLYLFLFPNTPYRFSKTFQVTLQFTEVTLTDHVLMLFSIICCYFQP